MTRAESLACVTVLLAAYPRDVQAGTQEAYALHLADLDRDSTLRAVRDLIRTSKWLPTIAEIRLAVVRQALPDIPSLDEAWTLALSLITRWGRNVPPTNGNVYVSRTLKLLGRWEDVCGEPEYVLRRRFHDAYQRVVEQAEDAVRCGRVPVWLSGHVDRERLEGPQAKKALAQGVPEKESEYAS